MIGLGVGLHTGVVTKAKAIQFDGASDSHAAATFTEDIAEVSFYVKPLDGDNQVILYFGGASIGTKHIKYASAGGASRSISLNTHSTFGFPNSTKYIDGVEDALMTLGEWSHVRITFDEVTTSTLEIGSDPINWGEFAIHSLELKDAAGVVVGKYPLNEGHGTTTYDTSGNNLTAGSLSVGDTYGGGLVYKIDTTGNNIYIAAEEDLEGTYGWGCTGTSTGADGTAIGTGYQNTLDILAGCSDTDSAAYAASTATIEGYSDWYLPSKDELDEMHNTIGHGASNAGNFADSAFYWSSSENSSDTAWAILFQYDSTNANGKNNASYVRPVRVVKGALGSTANGTIYDGVWVDV